MHEISLCESVRSLLEEQAAEKHFSRVKRIWLEIGALSCVEPEALRFGFDVVMRGSLAEGAELDIAAPPATAFCPNCNRDVPVKHRFDLCPICGAAEMAVTGGEELRIKKLEVV